MTRRAVGTAVPGAVGVGNLIADYAWLVDRWDVGGIVSLFTPDGEFDLGFGRVYSGVSELTALYGALSWSGTSHHCSQPRIDVGPLTASSRCAMYAMHRDASGGEMELWGAYLDDIVRIGGSWRFRRRRLRASLEKGATPAQGQRTRFELLARGVDAGVLDGDAQH